MENQVLEDVSTVGWGQPREENAVDLGRRQWGDPPGDWSPNNGYIVSVQDVVADGNVTFFLRTRESIDALLRHNGSSQVAIDLLVETRHANGYCFGTTITFPRTLDEARNKPPDTWIDHFNYTDRDFPRMQADQRRALQNICYIYHWFRHAKEDADLGQVWAEFVEERTNGILGSWWEPSPGEAPLLALSQWAQHRIPAVFPQNGNSAVAHAAVVVNGWFHAEGGREMGDESDGDGETAIESQME